MVSLQTGISAVILPQVRVWTFDGFQRWGCGPGRGIYGCVENKQEGPLPNYQAQPALGTVREQSCTWLKKKAACEKTNSICAPLIYLFVLLGSRHRWPQVGVRLCVLLNRMSYWAIKGEKTLYIRDAAGTSIRQPMSVAAARCSVPGVPQRKWKTCLTETILATSGTAACPGVRVCACVRKKRGDVGRQSQGGRNGDGL